MITRTDIRLKIDQFKSENKNISESISDWLLDQGVPEDEREKILDDLKSYDNY